MARRKTEKETGRPSVYLVNKCESMEKLVDFFLATEGGYCRTFSEKLTTFLAQIDFWDWEIENLIFSLTSFSERVKAWKSTGSLCEYLNRQGLMVKNSVLQDLEYKREFRSGSVRPRLNEKGELEYVPGGDREVVAPFENLNKVILKWNRLLTLCEQNVLLAKKVLESAIHFGAQLLPNLDKYRKEEIIHANS